MNYFEDFHVGARIALGSHTFTAAEIKAFAAKFDPQPFHLDEAAAARSHFGALCASGWHTAVVWMRHRAEHCRLEEEALRARGEMPSQRGPSPGFRDLKWLKPVYAGDTIAYATEVVETRRSNSRPDWGLVTSLNTGANQNGELVLSFLGSAFIERRPLAASP
jgi:acyl dehydratase